MVLTANAFLNNEVCINRIGFRDNPSKTFPSGHLSRYLGRVNIPLHHFGANAPTHIVHSDVSFSYLRIRRNSRGVIPFDCRAGRLPGGGIIYRVNCAGSTAGRMVLGGVSHSPLCSNIVRNMNPHCYPDLRSGVIHFASGRHRRFFIRPYNRGARRVCLRNVSSSLPRRIRIRFCGAVPTLHGIGVVHGTCTVRCSYVSPSTLGTALRVGGCSKLCNTNRFGNSSKCRRTTTRKLITNVGTTLGIRRGRPLILSHTSSCVNALVSSLIAGNYTSPCEVVASHDRCHLVLERSGTSRELVPANRGLKLVSSRICERFHLGVRRGRTRVRHLGDAFVTPGTTLGRLLGRHNATRVSAKVHLSSLIGHPRLSCGSLTPFSGKHPRLFSSIYRGIRARVGCRKCVAHRRTRIGRVLHLRGGLVPGSVSCSGVAKLHLRTTRGLGGVEPAGVNRTSHVSNMDPTSMAILLVCLSGWCLLFVRVFVGFSRWGGVEVVFMVVLYFGRQCFLSRFGFGDSGGFGPIRPRPSCRPPGPGPIMGRGPPGTHFDFLAIVITTVVTKVVNIVDTAIAATMF